MGPSHNLNEFIKACKSSKVVGVSINAQDGAKYFNLNTITSILNFITKGGLENPQFINSKLWEKNPEKSLTIMIDAYGFFSGTKYGYIAFRFHPKLGGWYIKSFKKNKEIDPRNLALAKQLNKLQIKG